MGIPQSLGSSVFQSQKAGLSRVFETEPKMSVARLQDLPVEVLLLLVEHATNDNNNSDSNDSTDGGSDGHHNSDNVKSKTRQHLFSSLIRVNRRFHNIFEPLLYRAAIQTENNAITTLAAGDGNLDTLKKAVEYGADLNSVSWVPIPNWSPGGDFGTDLRNEEECTDTSWGICWATPLHMAVCEGHYDVVKYLFSIGVDVDVPGKLLCGCLSMGEIVAGLEPDWSPELWDGMVIASGVWTPLHYAICRRKCSVARLLISQGASLDITRYPLRDQIPRDNGIASLFGLDLTKPEKSASIRDRLGTLICSVGTSGPLFNDHEEAVFRDGYGGREAHADSVAALHTAVAVNDLSMIRHLVVDCGFNINTKDGGSATALHYSLAANSIKTVRYVLSLGADPNTYLDIACHPVVDSAAAWLVSYESSRKHVYDSCFKRFLQGAMTEYDSAVCWDLKASVMELFFQILICENFDNTIELLDTIVNVAEG
ncbi:Tankyrase-1 [Colletotrichum sp. SAR11_239]|nr:Tankyrase-1 [Colletotrichum sp. SAR11_239]